MTVYESEGTFDNKDQKFNIKIQTTDISPDEFYISTFYNICDENRYAIVGILQTKDGNITDFSNYPPDSVLNEVDIPFANLNNSYLQTGDKDIFKIEEGEKIDVYIHHGIGFNPKKKCGRQRIHRKLQKRNLCAFGSWFSPGE
jgi:hypothetical protein